MSSTNRTSLGLNQWLPEDRAKREDFNEDNRTINEELLSRAIISSGIWTPTATNATISNITESKWVKNGRSVQCALDCYIQKNVNDVITFGGLPFAASQTGMCWVPRWQLILGSNFHMHSGYVTGTTAHIAVWNSLSGATAGLNGSHITDTSAKGMRLIINYEAV